MKIPEEEDRTLLSPEDRTSSAGAAPTFPLPKLAERARSFGGWAAEYDRYRPGYPDELFDLVQRDLDLPSDPSVADLGAGTGRASIAMARRGWRVTALEPSGPMLEAMRAALAGGGVEVATVEAPAEATGLPGASVDLVTVAQAFHWFDATRAVPEMARITRQGGGAAVFWNVRDEKRSTFLVEYGDLLERHLAAELLERAERADHSDVPGELAAGGWFEVRDRLELVHQVDMAADDFVGLAHTSSYVGVGLHGAERERFRKELRDLIERHSTGGRIAVPYRLDLWLARRTSARAPEPSPEAATQTKD